MFIIFPARRALFLHLGFPLVIARCHPRSKPLLLAWVVAGWWTLALD